MPVSTPGYATGVSGLSMGRVHHRGNGHQLAEGCTSPSAAERLENLKWVASSRLGGQLSDAHAAGSLREGLAFRCKT